MSRCWRCRSAASSMSRCWRSLVTDSLRTLSSVLRHLTISSDSITIFLDSIIALSAFDLACLTKFFVFAFTSNTSFLAWVCACLTAKFAAVFASITSFFASAFTRLTSFSISAFLRTAFSSLPVSVSVSFSATSFRARKIVSSSSFGLSYIYLFIIFAPCTLTPRSSHSSRKMAVIVSPCFTQAWRSWFSLGHTFDLNTNAFM
mmetsp:Transcript_45622/g.62171  ORF Transcript_45622/g.62171 Transcript_45622/m.62171 type:complete len:203 (-) Transcript_45622:653-1261(-)